MNASPGQFVVISYMKGESNPTKSQSLFSFKCHHFCPSHLQLQVRVTSHVDQQAVEGGQALGVSLTAGTPCGCGRTYDKFTFPQHKHKTNKRESEADAPPPLSLPPADSQLSCIVR